MENKTNNVIVIGAGCAGYTACIYLSRAELFPILIEGNDAGGQLVKTTDIENFPGFPEGINGYELIENMRRQCLKYGTNIVSGSVKNILKTKIIYLK